MRYLVNIIALIMCETARFMGFLSFGGQNVVSYYYYCSLAVPVLWKKGGGTFLRGAFEERGSGGELSPLG
jgi:hypothetical protein